MTNPTHNNTPDKALVALRWQEPHPSHSYPNWYAYDADIKFEARIDTGRALCFGKFPLKINGHDYGTKFETLEEAKAFAQKKYEERLAPIYAKFTAAPSQPQHGGLVEALSNAVSALCSLRKNYADSYSIWSDVDRFITEGNAALAFDSSVVGEDEGAAWHLGQVLAADSGPKATAAFKAAREWFQRYDSALAKPTPTDTADLMDTPCGHCGGVGDIDDGDHPCFICGGTGKRAKAKPTPTDTGDTPPASAVERTRDAILQMDVSRKLSGYAEEALSGSDFTEWEAEQIARVALAALPSVGEEDGE